jgi:hypothetical protein
MRLLIPMSQQVQISGGGGTQVHHNFFERQTCRILDHSFYV